jgi:SAM-dependent methyltransferase
MQHSYDLFSPFYRELIVESGHFEDETRLAELLITKFDIESTDYILDAACGTGDLLSFLKTNGYSNIYGIDGSLGMIERAKEILPTSILLNEKWENLNKHHNLTGKFDMVIVLSLSLLHADEVHLPKILTNIKRIIKKGGVLAFDNRNWFYNSHNDLIEPNRTNEFRMLNRITKSDKNFVISDKCSYSNGRQIITYKIEHCQSSTENIELNVSYLIKTHNQYVSMLLEAGFDKAGHEKTKGWPYEIIYSIK